MEKCAVFSVRRHYLIFLLYSISELILDSVAVPS